MFHNLFQEAVNLIISTNEKLTKKLENNSSSKDAEEMKLYTQGFKFILDAINYTDKFNAVEFKESPVLSWRAGWRTEDKYNQFAFLMYMPCEGDGNGIMRLEHVVFDDEKMLHNIAYTITAGQEPSVAKYFGCNLDDDAAPDWEF